MYSSDEKSGATNIYVQMYIRTIKSVDLENMEMDLQIDFRSLWPPWPVPIKHLQNSGAEGLMHQDMDVIILTTLFIK